MTTVRRRLAASLAFSAAAALLPVLALSAPAQADPAGPDCSAEEAAFASAESARDRLRADLTAFVAGSWTPAYAAKAAAKATRSTRLDERAQAVAGLAEARSAYTADRNPTTLADLEAARYVLGEASQSLADARADARTRADELAAATSSRRLLNADLQTAKGRTAEAREALEECQRVVTLSISNMYAHAGVQWGDVTISGLLDGAYRLYPVNECSGYTYRQCWSAGGSVSSQSGGVLLLRDAFVANCGPAAESLRVYAVPSGEVVGEFAMSWTPVC